MDDEPATLPQGAPDRIESFLAEWRADEDIPAISATVFGADGVRFAIGLGERDVETGEPATPDTLYSVASLSKPVIATGILGLVEGGDIALHDEVGRYVDVLDDVPGDPITIAELLSHSSGIPRDFSAVFENLEDDQDLELFEHIAGAAQRRLCDRDRLMYANGGYYVLGEVIEAVDGRSYGQYAREAVLEPLDMERSSFDAESLRTDEEAMTGYALDEDGEFTETTYEGGAGPSGGLLSTPRELARLGRTVLGEGTVDGTRVLDPEHAAAAHRLQSPPVPTVDGSERGYGYGWEIGEFADQPLVGHLGGIDGAGAYLGVLPEAELGVALAYNRHGPPGVTIGLGVLAIALGEDPADLVRMIRVSTAVEELTGTYRAYRDAESLTVESGAAGTIRLSLESGMSFTASPDEIEDDRSVFSTRPGNGTRWTVEFLRTDEGTRVVLSMGKWTTAFSEA